MNDETPQILATFREYTETFRQKKAAPLLRFYAFPALMVDRDEKPKVLSNSVIAFIGLSLAIQKLKTQGYAYSHLHELGAKQLQENLAIVSGTATRHNDKDKIIDEFGFTYTLRKTSQHWKIIAGIIHKTETFLPL
jgi:ketosteroid isomerase-like protein